MPAVVVVVVAAEEEEEILIATAAAAADVVVATIDTPVVEAVAIPATLYPRLGRSRKYRPSSSGTIAGAS